MKTLVVAFILLFEFASGFAQEAEVRVICPAAYRGKTLILRTSLNNMFVDSVKADRDTVTFHVPASKLPDSFFLMVRGPVTSSTVEIFPDAGCLVKFDETNIDKPIVLGSKTHEEFLEFQKDSYMHFLLGSHEARMGESRARRASNADSLNYWLQQQENERLKVLDWMNEYVRENPASYLSLYFVRYNWHFFKNKNVMEKLDKKMAYHESYRFLLASQAENRDKKLPDFTLPDYQGKLFTQKDFEGKYLVIDFWGTWCDPCVRSIPKIREAYLRLKQNKNVVFISIANEQSSTDPQKVEKMAGKLGIEWPQFIQVLNDQKALAPRMLIRAYPTLLLVDRERNVVNESIGDGIPDTLKNIETIFGLK